MSNDLQEFAWAWNRRTVLQRMSMGLGAAALAELLGNDLSAAPTTSPISKADDPATTHASHFAPRAKHVIFIHLVGAPSHLELFDDKPKLRELDGELLPDELWNGLRLAFIRERPRLLGSAYQFQKHGEGGVELSELLPHLAGVADEMCVIKSLHTEQFNHAPAQLMFTTGFGRFGRPSFGSWVSYGLGSENRNLPSFVVMNTGSIAGAGNSLWGSGFLPSIYQGVEFRPAGDPVLFLSDPPGMTRGDRRSIVDGINHLNNIQLADVRDPEIATRIRQYEMAFRMQTAVPELMDTSQETKATQEMYGIKNGQPGFATNCLLARRLVEAGVRYVQLFDQGWDHHSGVFPNVKKKAQQVDQPLAALIRDLRQRGLLDDTLVVWGAEFGRTPMVQDASTTGRSSDKVGRDHHKDAYSVWMAGGGVKGGMTYGKTDDIGFHVAENPMHVNDFHATLLHLLGLDHEKLTYRYQGRNFRLTDVAGNVAHEIIA